MQTTSAADIESVLDESGPDYEEFSYEPATGGTRVDVYMVTLVYESTEYDVYVEFKPAGEERFAVEPKLHEYVDRTVELVDGYMGEDVPTDGSGFRGESADSATNAGTTRSPDRRHGGGDRP